MQHDFFVCSKCDKATNGAVEVQQEAMCDKMEIVKGFCYLGNRLNASGECEAVQGLQEQEWDGRNSESVRDIVWKKTLFVD